MVVTLIGASIAYSIKGTPQFAIAVLSGGGVAVVNGTLLAWRMVRAALHPAHEAHHQLRLMYFYAAERFLVVIVLLYLCIAVLKLSPLALLGGFVIGQAVLPVGRLFLSSFKTEIVTKNV
jgi:F0F1-type ATP synthase assembly protein I